MSSAPWRRYVPVMIEIDRDGRTADRYKVDGIPTVLVLNGNGEVLRQGRPDNRRNLPRVKEEEEEEEEKSRSAPQLSDISPGPIVLGEEGGRDHRHTR